MIYPDCIQKCILTIFRIDNISVMHSQYSYSFCNFYLSKWGKFGIIIVILKMTSKNGHNYGMMMSQAWKRKSCLPYLQRIVLIKGSVCIPQKFCREFYLGRSIMHYMVNEFRKYKIRVALAIFSWHYSRKTWKHLSYIANTITTCWWQVPHIFLLSLFYPF